MLFRFVGYEFFISFVKCVRVCVFSCPWSEESAIYIYIYIYIERERLYYAISYCNQSGEIEGSALGAPLHSRRAVGVGIHLDKCGSESVSIEPMQA